MHVYNAIIVLKEILSVFPLGPVVETGASLDRAMDEFIEREERGDLKILARAYVASSLSVHLLYSSISSYSASLKKRESLWTTSKPVAKVLHSIYRNIYSFRINVLRRGLLPRSQSLLAPRNLVQPYPLVQAPRTFNTQRSNVPLLRLRRQRLLHHELSF
jgi:hypothetical protein